RETYLDQVCAGDQAFRDRVEALLDVHEKEQRFLKSNRSASSSTIDHIATERPGTMIGRYTLREQIGEGGMGTVFVAEQERPIRRYVALKVIKPGMDSKAVIARFEAERQALAMMDHPNIAKVLDAGTTESGRPYFAMELVKGVPITEFCDCDENLLTVRERLSLFIQVCQAIQHAHQKGIIHRDIKPSNVLVTLHDGQPVPKVIDFGVAKALNARLTDKTIYTEHLQVVGTLLYMSPEQAEMSGMDIDTRCDVYSLGVLLYELLTGTTPFQKEDLDRAGFDEQRRIIRDREPPRASVRISSLGETATIVASHRKTDPRKLKNLVRGDLDWIILKALEKTRTRRYESPSHLADDIARHLENKAIIARPPSVTYRLSRFAVRNRLLVATCAIVLFAVLGGIAALGWSTVVATQAWHKAERARADALDREYLHRINLAFHALNSGNRSQLNEHLTSLRKLRGRERPPNFEERILAARNAEFLAVPELPATGSAVTSIACCPTQPFVAMADIDGELRVFNVQDVEHPVPLNLNCDKRISYVAFSGDGKRIAAGGLDGVSLWRFPDMTPIHAETWHDGPVLALTFAPQSQHLAIAHADGQVELLSEADGQAIWKSTRADWRGVWSVKLAFSSDEQYLVGVINTSLTVWNVANGEELDHRDSSSVADGVAQFTPEELILGSQDGLTHWGIEDSRLRESSRDKLDIMATCGALSPDGTTMAIGTADFSVRVIDTKSFAVKTRLLHDDYVNAVAYSGDGRFIFAGGRDNKVRIWDTRQWLRQESWGIARTHEPPMAIAPNGQIATVHVTEGQQFVEIWNPATGPTGKAFAELGMARVGALAFSHDGKLLAAGDNDGVIWLWDVEQRTSLVTWPAHSGSSDRPFTVSTNLVGALVFSPDNQKLISGGDSPDLVVWDIRTVSGTSQPACETLRGEDGEGWVSALALSKDGFLAVSGGEPPRRGRTEIWDLNHSQPVRIQSLPHAEWARAVAFSSDGKML
ncbi:MAG: protein kinase, partial [Planctomycetales bacterium]|nr:protein kinase [Planctomycetales bacterium]